MKKFLVLTLLSTLSISSYSIDEKEALLKIKEFSSTLKKELKKGLIKSPKEAVNTCNLKAPQIANKLSTSDFQIGRVSLKNRNPNNYPQEWMLQYIQDFHNKKIKKDHIVVQLEDGKKALLKPIPTMPLCLKCHGRNIDPSLQKVITKLYPDDKATGYQVGDIRGFFWVKY